MIKYCRVFHLLWELGWDDLDFWCSTVCPILLGLSANWQKGPSRWPRRWDIQIKGNPTAVHDQMNHSVQYFRSVSDLISQSYRETPPCWPTWPRWTISSSRPRRCLRARLPPEPAEICQSCKNHIISNRKFNIIAELLTIMITTRFLDSIGIKNRFQPIFGSISHNSMIVTCYDDQNFQLDRGFGVD